MTNAVLHDNPLAGCLNAGFGEHDAAPVPPRRPPLTLPPMAKTLICSGAIVLSLVLPVGALDFSELFPESIKCVYIVAPSSQAPADVVIKGTNALVQAGYKVKVSEGVWTYSEDAAVRARYLEEAWNDDETDLILCARGGSGGADTLAALDLEKLGKRNVPFVGFSNISTLLNGFVAKNISRPITGPLLTTLVNYPNTAESLRRARAVIGREDIPNTKLTVRRAPASAISGKPIGGHFPSISKMGVEWLPDTTGRIAFLEVNSTYTLATAKEAIDLLVQKQYLTKVAAVVLCDMSINGTSAEKEELRTYITDSVTCPVLSGYPYGHVAELYAIDYDRVATIATDGTLSWESYAVDKTFDAAADKTLEVVDPIAGVVNVSVNPTGTGTVRIDGGNTYVGPTTLGGGVLEVSELAPVSQPSSLGCRGDLYLEGGEFRYAGADSATFGHPVICSVAAVTIKTTADLALAGTLNATKTINKTGDGTLTFAGGGKCASVNVKAGTLVFNGGDYTASSDINVVENVSDGKIHRANLRMTGGTLDITGTHSIFLGRGANESHVTCDISGGMVTISKNFALAYQGDTNEKHIDLTIRDNAVVDVGASKDHRVYFDSSSASSRLSLTVRDGGTLKTGCLSRQNKNAVTPIVLFDGGKIFWKHGFRYSFGSGGGADYYNTMKGPIYVGTRGVTFTGTSKDKRYLYDVPLCASNTVAETSGSGVVFACGGYELAAAMSWDGQTVIANDASVMLGTAGTLPSSSAVSVDGSLVVTGGVKSAGSIVLNGNLDLVKDKPLELTIGGLSGVGTVNLYTSAKRTKLVADEGTYPLVTAPLGAKGELERFAVTGRCGNLTGEVIGRLTVTEKDGRAVLSLFVGEDATLPTCAVLGTNGENRVEFRGAAETIEEGGVRYVKPGTMARLSARDANGLKVVGGWFDNDGHLYYGETVTVAPTNLTTYTAVFGNAWLWDGQKVTDGEWEFEGTVTGSRVTVGKPIAAPDHGFLNLATPVTNAVGDLLSFAAVGGDATANCVFGAAANACRQKLRYLLLGEGIESLGYGAFLSCSNLQWRVIIPPGMKELPPYAFGNCTSLESADLSGVTNINNHAFYHDSSLKSVWLCEDLRIIGRYAFNGATRLAEIKPMFPDALEEIGRAAFYTGSGTMKLAGDARFAGVRRVCYSAFCNCQLDSVYLPSVTNLGYRAFYGCPITNAVFGADRVNFYDEEGTGKGYGQECFYCDQSIVRQFHFPVLAPNLPVYKNRSVGNSSMFGTKDGRVSLYGAWWKDRPGWRKVLADIGTPINEVSDDRKTYQPQDGKVKGTFNWYNGHYGWLVDYGSGLIVIVQ